VKDHPAHFFVMKSWFLRILISTFVISLLASSARMDATPSGFLEGHLKIISSREVELADEIPSKMTPENHIDYPLVILSHDKQTEVAHVTADENGKYRIALPPGDYVLDCHNHRRRHIRTTPQPFTIVANQTVRVDMAVDTGVR
jgi:hypothetical protein